ncbi:MAG: tyrosine-type recombinase/integrase [Candidatus Limnocylindria bacterium]
MRGLSPRTLEWYSMIASRFVAFRAEHGADPGLQAVTIAEARAFVAALQDGGLSPSSVAGFVRGLKVIFAWCAAEGLVEADPLRRLRRPREPRRLIATLGPVELERLLTTAGPRERLMIALLLDTGLRLGELADLRVDDVLADGYLRVRGKGAKERLVPLGSVSQARLAAYLRHGRPRPVGRRVDHVFLARDGRPLTAAAIQHVLRRLGRRAGLDGVRTNPHTFRHTFAKLYLLNGGDLFSLQRILGHATLDMVRRYVNLDVGDIKRQHEAASPLDRLATTSATFARG